MTSIAFIGAGRLGCTLATAMDRCGFDVQWVASRHLARARALAAGLRACEAVAPVQAAQADLVFITVPDDAIGPVTAQLQWRAGQGVVHCSGATEVSVLEPAARRGALIGGFHPLQIFSDPQAALGLLAGSTATIEAPPPLRAQLEQVAERLRMQVLTLPPGARALYHGAASYAASFLLSMLHEAAALWQQIGIDEAQALHALLPLAQGTLACSARQGLAGALAGPVSRGDAGVLRRHLQALDAVPGGHGALYREFTHRQLQLARESGRLDEARLGAMQALLDRP